MLALANGVLRVELLDPADPRDRAHLGLRYCWGGYIWQVNDVAAGPLVAGPEWPEKNPSPFNGQGLPESFRHAEFGTGRPLIIENAQGFIIGIGDVARNMAGALDITTPCPWSVTASQNSIEFCTEQAGHDFACQLTRRIALTGRTLTSSTRLANLGDRPLPLHWFAHPFFTLHDRLITCGLPATWDMAANPGYEFDDQHRLSFKRRFRDRDDGHFEQLIVGRDTPLRAELSHPHLTGLVFSTDFTPDSCPVWANSNTWSIEPYLATDLAPGTDRAWSLTYEFGPVI